MGGITVSFVGNATTLISAGRRDGNSQITLLTNPNFLRQGQHTDLGYGLVSRRLREPACYIDELPALDAVVLWTGIISTTGVFASRVDDFKHAMCRHDIGDRVIELEPGAAVTG